MCYRKFTLIVVIGVMFALNGVCQNKTWKILTWTRDTDRPANLHDGRASFLYNLRRRLQSPDTTFCDQELVNRHVCVPPSFYSLFIYCVWSSQPRSDGILKTQSRTTQGETVVSMMHNHVQWWFIEDSECTRSCSTGVDNFQSTVAVLLKPAVYRSTAQAE